MPKSPSRSRAKTSSRNPLRSKVERVRSTVSDFVNDEAFDRRLDQGVEFLAANGFGGAQLKHLFSLSSRRQKFAYIASVTSVTVAVTLFSQGFIGRTLKRVPFLRWA